MRPTRRYFSSNKRSSAVISPWLFCRNNVRIFLVAAALNFRRRSDRADSGARLGSLGAIISSRISASVMAEGFGIIESYHILALGERRRAQVDRPGRHNPLARKTFSRRKHLSFFRGHMAVRHSRPTQLLALVCHDQSRQALERHLEIRHGLPLDPSLATPNHPGVHQLANDLGEGERHTGLDSRSDSGK
jgi:hypothetical protein